MIEQRILELSPRLERMAGIYASGTLETKDDLYQGMVLHLLERQRKDQTFSEQNDSYILDAGRKRVCWPSLRRREIYNRHFVVVDDCPEDDLADWFDMYPDDDLNPEDATIQLEEALTIAQALRALSGRELEVLTLAVKGVGTGEIAAKLGCSPPAVSCYKRRAMSKISRALGG